MWRENAFSLVWLDFFFFFCYLNVIWLMRLSCSALWANWLLKKVSRWRYLRRYRGKAIWVKPNYALPSDNAKTRDIWREITQQQLLFQLEGEEKRNVSQVHLFVSTQDANRPHPTPTYAPLTLSPIGESGSTLRNIEMWARREESKRRKTRARKNERKRDEHRHKSRKRREQKIARFN